MAAWGRVADYTQRTMSVLLFGLTVYGLVILTRGGIDVLKRHKQRKAGQLTASLDNEGDNEKPA